MAYISVSKMLLEGSFPKGNSFLGNIWWITKKGNFDGLHKQLKNAFGMGFPKKEISFLGNNFQKRKFDGWHNQLKNDFGKNYQKRKLYARKFGKMPEKS